MEVEELVALERQQAIELERTRARAAQLARARLEAETAAKAAAEAAAAAKAATEAAAAEAAVTAGSPVAVNSVEEVLDFQLQRIRGVLAAARADNEHTSRIETKLLAELHASYETAATQLATGNEHDFEAHATAVRAAVEVVLREQAAMYRLKQQETLNKVLKEQHTRVMDFVRTSLQANNAHWHAVYADIETKLKARPPS